MNKPILMCVPLLGLFTPLSEAQDMQCLFTANQPATVQIKYEYTTPDGDGVDYGSGFIVSPSGHVITNAHVVSPHTKDVTVNSAMVTARAGSRLNPPVEASVVSRDSESDLALLKLPLAPGAAPWPTVTIAPPDNIAVGTTLTALGFAGASDLALVPGGQKTAENTMLDGQLKPWWQTNLALNPGNSGSPVFGRYGTVVGVAVAINNGGQLVTYIIPITRAQHLLTAAGAEMKKSAACAAFPVCQHPSHGIERYAIDELKSEWTPWRGGGYSRSAACKNYEQQLKNAYPSAILSFIRDDENSQDTGFRHFEYRYFCEFRRQENPVYVAKQSAACMEPEK
ncbi:serine protease [Janthinobacterium sp. PLB04]|uniref:Trypsin-like peptidase domain-containing protein n=1 Tax=Janthinobacterium lividum TaxID=29581 RepID=A0AAJ4T7P4_9BURK|nr:MULTISPECIES: serine protease [Janthinobacterium]KAB0324728.1 trypsin-like peptidase domain-containing protein [Janthinobacterium lividum]QSX98838.1 trypsin-like peptidase domain-containing protein [Janthinobacterium lividum]UGQ38813.1 serine protease [Janthinobacterium sp. PLB04]